MYINICVKIPIGLRRHAGLVWESDQACRSSMKHVEVSDGSPIRHVRLR